MNQTLKNLQCLEEQVSKLSMKADHNTVMYMDTSEEVINAAKHLNIYLYHPYESKNYYWFIYKSKVASLTVKVKGPSL